MKILISGYEPFGGNAINPTEKLIEAIAGETFEGVELRTVLLPVHFDACAELIIREIEVFRPDAVLSLGLAAGRSGITPERIAVNIKDVAPDVPYADNRGARPVDEPIHPEGPDGLFTTLPIRTFVNRLKEADIPASISHTAGTFICNNTMYGILDYIRTNRFSTIAGFIHFPASTEMAAQNPAWPTLPQETMLQALRIIVQTTIDALRAGQ